MSGYILIGYKNIENINNNLPIDILSCKIYSLSGLKVKLKQLKKQGCYEVIVAKIQTEITTTEFLDINLNSISIPIKQELPW